MLKNSLIVTARERLRVLRDSLANRRRMLAIASATGPYIHTSTSLSPPLSSTSSSHSPPHSRSLHSRRLSSTSASTSHTPTPRVAHPFPSIPTSPQSMRPQVSIPTSSTHTPSPSRPVLSPASAGTPYKFRRLSDGTLVPVDNTGLDANFARQIEEANFKLSVLSDTLARARSGLVQELVEVFSVVEVTLIILLFRTLYTHFARRT